MNKIQQKAND